MTDTPLPVVGGIPCPYGDLPGQTPLRDTIHRMLTRALFYETRTEGYQPIYTLKPREHEGLPSARQIYLDCADPTEWVPAHVLVGSWDHWQKLIKCDWFQPFLIEWRDALDVKVRAEAIRAIRHIAGGTSPNALQAAKWIAARGWDQRRPGRPTNEERDNERKRAALLDDEVEDDYQRMHAGNVTPIKP